MDPRCVLVIVVAAAACYVQPAQNQQAYPQSQPYAQDPQQGNNGYAPTQAGTCDGVCRHYLGCKQIGDPAAYQQCSIECSQYGASQPQMASYEQTDCASAISIIEGQAQGPAAGSQANSSQCNGCVSDGTNCTWLSQSNWGAGTYSGAAMDCDPSCCRH